MPAETLAPTTTRVNDFALTVATANGTGSQTANNSLFRALFGMGIPVNGKNLFPSNIQGLPTWYTIRANGDGWTARPETAEIMVAFNPVTLADDVNLRLPTGGVCIYSLDGPAPPKREDVTLIGVPVKPFVNESGVTKKLREYIANMVYVGVLCELIGIEMAEIDAALVHHFGATKRKVVDTNLAVALAAQKWTAENVDVDIPYRAERMNGTKGKFLIDGNEAAALGSIFGGVTVVAWYPITPASSVAEALIKHGRLLRTNEDGTTTLAIIQSEDELAAAGAVLGAGWAGARSMTATSGPGISLMAEMVGLAWFAEIPSVFWNVARVGPSTGLPTRTSQGDLLATYLLSHGETRHPVLIPANPEECFEFGWRAFDLAERLQTPIFVLSDLDLGMNLWMSDPFTYPDKPMDRGKVLDADAVKANGFARYRDVDGDGICQRTIPGNTNPQAAYFARGTGHNEAAVYTESSEEWVKNMARLERKFETGRTLMPRAILHETDGATCGILSFGTNDVAILEGRARLEAAGIVTDYLRVRSLPLGTDVTEFLERHDHVYVLENSNEAQMTKIMRMDLPGLALKLRPATLGDGLPMTAGWVEKTITNGEAAE